MARVDFAVNGTLMRGLPLNANLVAAGATFEREARTAPQYRLWSIHDVHPGMIRTADASGRQVELEVWSIPMEVVTQVLLDEPPGLTVGKVLLESGEEVLGILAEPALVHGQREITEFGGWRAYLAAREEEAP